MIYATLKWYALTLGAWRRWRWLRTATAYQILRDVWSGPALRAQLAALEPLGDIFDRHGAYQATVPLRTVTTDPPLPGTATYKEPPCVPSSLSP